MSALAAYIPFVHPISAVHEWWWLLMAPLALGISIIYKALRMTTLEGFWREVSLMTAQIVLAMVALAIALGLFIVLVIPLLAAE